MKRVCTVAPWCVVTASTRTDVTRRASGRRAGSSLRHQAALNVSCKCDQGVGEAVDGPGKTWDNNFRLSGLMDWMKKVYKMWGTWFWPTHLWGKQPWDSNKQLGYENLYAKFEKQKQIASLMTTVLGLSPTQVPIVQSTSKPPILEYKTTPGYQTAEQYSSLLNTSRWNNLAQQRASLNFL